MAHEGLKPTSSGASLPSFESQPSRLLALCPSTSGLISLSPMFNWKQGQYFPHRVGMKIKPSNGYKMLIPGPGTEKVLVNVNLLSSLNIDFLAQCWLIASAEGSFLSLPHHPKPTRHHHGHRWWDNYLIPTWSHLAHPGPVGGGCLQNCPHLPRPPVPPSS